MPRLVDPIRVGAEEFSGHEDAVDKQEVAVTAGQPVPPTDEEARGARRGQRHAVGDDRARVDAVVAQTALVSLEDEARAQRHTDRDTSHQHALTDQEDTSSLTWRRSNPSSHPHPPALRSRTSNLRPLLERARELCSRTSDLVDGRLQSRQQGAEGATRFVELVDEKNVRHTRFGQKLQ